MVNKLSCFLLLVVITMCWLACSSTDRGIVYDKEFRQANIGTVKETTKKLRSRGRTPLELTSTKVVNFPDRWAIYVHSESKKDSAVYFVDKATFDSIKIGDEFIFDSQKVKTEEPYSIKKF